MFVAINSFVHLHVYSWVGYYSFVVFSSQNIHWPTKLETLLLITFIVFAHLRRHQREGAAFLHRIVACDETWTDSWEPELKRQSASWCGPDSSRPQKAHRAIADLKVMHITFFDWKGIIFDQPVPVGQRVDGNYYLSTLRKLRRAVRDKRPDLHRSGVILLQDNAGPHRKREVLKALNSWDWETLHHPPYSPDLSPCDFFFSPRLRSPCEDNGWRPRRKSMRRTNQVCVLWRSLDLKMALMFWCEDWNDVSRLRDVILNPNILKLFSGNFSCSILFA